MIDVSKSEFVVLDVETTGLEPAQGAEVIEIGAQKLKGRKVIDEFERFVKPRRPITAEMTKIHGITNQQVEKEGQDPAKVFPEFVEWLGSSILVAQNAPFDVGFINHHLTELELPKVHNQVLDTKEIAKRYVILASYSLKNLAKFFKVPQPEAHRAMVDVETTREVFFKLIDRAKEKSNA